MNWATVTETGTRITVPKSTVTLTIPQGAIANRQTQDIYVAVLTQDTHKPKLDHLSQIAITPVVQWGTASGPSSRTLQKPVVISVPHQLQNMDQKRIRIYHCSDLDSSTSDWSILACDVQIDPSFCHLITDQSGAFVLVSSLTDLNSISSESIMTPSTKQALCRCLDVPTCQGNDWRKLAEVIGANHYSAHFANQPSPSEAILNLWEARNNFNDNKSGLKALAQLLRDINRPDAIVILERELK